MTLVFFPSFATVEAALDWAEEHGYTRVVLWWGPDQLIRGSGRK